MHLVADGGGSSAAVPIPRLRPARAEHLRELLQSGDDGRWKSHLLVLVGRETACPLRGDGSACLTLGDQRVECLTCQHGAGVAVRVRRFAAGRTRGGGTGRGCHRGSSRWGVRHGTGHWRPRAGLARRVAPRAGPSREAV